MKNRSRLTHLALASVLAASVMLTAGCDGGTGLILFVGRVTNPNG